MRKEMVFDSSFTNPFFAQMRKRKQSLKKNARLKKTPQRVIQAIRMRGDG
jgi:hypothetical protein